MKYIDSILYLEFSELVDAGVSENTIKQANRKQSSNWIFAKDPEDRRRLLVHYDKLKDQYKDLVKAHYGDPYQYMADQVISKHLTLRQQDLDTINSIKVNGKRLPDYLYKRYCDACRYLNMLSSLTVQDVRTLGYQNIITDFYPAVIRLIKTRKVHLPTTYITLRRKLSEYAEHGAVAAINGRVGNTNSRKVDELGKALLKELLAKHNNYNAEQISIIYNAIGAKRNFKKISAKTVLNYAEGLEIIAGRTGTGAWRNAYDMVVHRSRPSRPGMLWVGDATPYELYFQMNVTRDNGHKEVKYWLRKVVYVVVDAFNDLVVGFSIGETESNELARLAWKNACLNTGIFPDQVKVDHFGIKELTPLYEKLALNPDYFTPSAVGNARDKVIESFFSRLYDQVVRFHDNAAGRNIQSKEKTNRDTLDRIKHSFPDEAGVIKMIEADLMMWNNKIRPRLNNRSLLQQWQQADHSQARKYDTRMFLEVFGRKHTYTNTLTSRGLQVSIGGKVRTYHKPGDLELARTMGTSYNVYYDENDLANILIKTDDGRIQFVLEEDAPVPMAFGDFKEGDRKRLNGKLDQKKAVVQKLVIGAQKERRELLEKAGIMNELEAEAIARHMFTVKGNQKNLLYEAQNVLKGDRPSNEPSIGDEYDGDLIGKPVEKPVNIDYDDGY